MDFLKVDQYIEDHLEENLVELSKLIAVPSISAERRQLKECADLLISFLERRRFSIQRFSNHDAPIIVAEKGEGRVILCFFITIMMSNPRNH